MISVKITKNKIEHPGPQMARKVFKAHKEY